MNFPPNIPPPPGAALITEIVMPLPVMVDISKPKKRINSRSKGQRGEREVIGLLQDIVDSVRLSLQLPAILLQRNTLQSHVGGHDITGLAGFSVEVKFQEMEYSADWWRQCLKQAAKDRSVPILIYRRVRQPWRVKFRAFVATPHDVDQVELDVTTDFADFADWFEIAYREACNAR